MLFSKVALCPSPNVTFVGYPPLTSDEDQQNDTVSGAAPEDGIAVNVPFVCGALAMICNGIDFCTRMLPLESSTVKFRGPDIGR